MASYQSYGSYLLALCHACARNLHSNRKEFDKVYILQKDKHTEHNECAHIHACCELPGSFEEDRIIQAEPMPGTIRAAV